ncbi:MAG: hypothetical protein IJQ81_09225 [Oscillibacter sp.]|nr:hypothetical protein [Oscillibacter sp.]
MRNTASYLSELPENVVSVTLADVGEPFRDEALKAAAQRETPFSVTFLEKDAAQLFALEELARMAERIVILSTITDRITRPICGTFSPLWPRATSGSAFS